MAQPATPHQHLSSVPLFGEVRITEDVATDFARLVASELSSSLSAGDRSSEAPFRLACSGGGSGTACFQALAKQRDIAWEALACFFVDERCVDPDSDDANQKTIAQALGDNVAQLAGYFPMDCATGAQAYESLLREKGIPDLIQLGLGPDGHTASIFPNSPALSSPTDRLVVMNTDPLGNNVHERMTLTYGAISLAPLVVFTVIGANKRPAVEALIAGVDLPAGRVRAARVIWLCDIDACPEALT